MRTVWLLVVAILVAQAAGCAKQGAKIGDMRANPKDDADMVWVPAGEFLMGSNSRGEDADKPQRKVYLDGYWIYKYEVTVAHYRRFCNATDREMPDWPNGGWKDDHPMVNVTWQDAVDYATWAGVSLPTEAQWEKAARGTDGRTYPWGNKWDASKCANSMGKKIKRTQPVGSFASDASPYGCMDMAGNVWEWCADWYDPKYYKNAPARNPTGPSEGVELKSPFGGTITGARVMRGGSWYWGPGSSFQCAHRLSCDPTNRSPFSGFRCAKTP